MIRRLIILLLIVGCGTEPEDCAGEIGKHVELWDVCYNIEETDSLNFDTNRKITIKSFCHHYGIKRVYTTGNIFQVAMEMGHKSVTTTQHYLRFQLDELRDHFPSLVPIIDNMANIEINMQDGNKKMGTQYSNVNKLHT